MPAKLVDVFDKKGKLLNTYKISMNGLNYEPQNKEFEKLGLENALDDGFGPKEGIVAKVRKP